jgi:UDP-N-acetylmuramyl tripeptide synthase
MHKVLGTFVGKSVKTGLKYRRGGGQALPGLIVEKLFPDYLSNMLSQLPDGVVLITGTNGKTTTTKMVTHLLSANGKRVLTNSTGSNLSRGIASSVSQKAKLSGKLPYDVAVLEIDEAAARRLVSQVKPRWILALNVSRDQLDRFGEVDTIASYIKTAMKAADGVVTNACDPHLAAAARQLKNKDVSYFGFADSLRESFPSDYELAAVKTAVKTRENREITETDVELSGFRENSVKYIIGGKKYEAKLKVSGQHNYLNGAAALALAKKLLPQAGDEELVRQLAEVSLAFGRGEKYKLKSGAVVELVLVKNPASFTQALASYGTSKANLMIAINDRIADGRDVSWLWDVNFGPLASGKVELTSGTRAADMALRLKYDGINVIQIEPDLSKALGLLARKNGDKVVLATYTAMLSLYSYLSKGAEKIG